MNPSEALKVFENQPPFDRDYCADRSALRFDDGVLTLGKEKFAVTNVNLLLSSLGLPKGLGRKKGTLAPMAINNALQERATEPAVIYSRKGTFVGLQDPECSVIDSRDLLRSLDIPANAVVCILPTGILITHINADEGFEARRGDPVSVGYCIENREIGSNPGVRFATGLMRLLCTNGAMVTHKLFSQRFSAGRLSDINTSLTSFVDSLGNRHKLLADAAAKMVVTPLGRKTRNMQAVHARLLGHRNWDRYDESSSFWDGWNSITESAKTAPRRLELEQFAGRLMEPFLPISLVA
jgi:hypothetical protein